MKEGDKKKFFARFARILLILPLWAKSFLVIQGGPYHFRGGR